MRSGFIAGGASAVKYDLPGAVARAAPDGGERADARAVRIQDGPGAECQHSGIEHFDTGWTPGERRLVAVEIRRPSFADRVATPHCPFTGKEDGFLVEKGLEHVEATICHRGGEGGFDGDDLRRECLYGWHIGSWIFARGE